MEERIEAKILKNKNEWSCLSKTAIFLIMIVLICGVCFYGLKVNMMKGRCIKRVGSYDLNDVCL